LLENLFSEVQVGPTKLRNRIYVTPHSTMFVSDGHDNIPGDRLAAYCSERARGGAALVEVSMAVISNEPLSYAGSTEAQFSPYFGGLPESLTGRFPIRGSDPLVVDGYKKLARAIHAHGSKCFIEVTAGGSNFGSDVGVTPFPTPSISGVSPMIPFTPREMDDEDIEKAIEGFGVAAKYIRDGGLDGIDFHGSHGALMAEFLSPAMNKRTDRWGGSLENRMRFVFEVITRVREYVGEEISVGMRLMGDDRVEGGILKDTPEIVRRLDGKLDWITADQGIAPQHEDWESLPMYVPSGYNLRITNPFKALVKSTKIGVVGRYVDPVFADYLVGNGQADMVAMTRALIADPELPNKAREGRLDEIRPCIGVLQDCWNRTVKGLPMSCTVNPVVSREREWGIGTLTRSEHPKRVLVIGGGPAGLETGRIAAERGHDVVIYEKGHEPGGQILLASKLPGRSDIKALVQWQMTQLKNLGVKLRYGHEVTPDSDVIQFVLDEERPDVVVIATGSRAMRSGYNPYTFLDVSGWQEPMVCTDIDILDGTVVPGRRVIVGDTLSFIEAPGIAEYLARDGREVEIVTYHANVGMELKSTNHWPHVLPRIFSLGVKVSPFTWIKSISGKTVKLYNVYEASLERTVEDVDNVVMLTGKIQNNSLHAAFKNKVKELFLVGDARIAGARIGPALYDAQQTARLL
jgi:2,4-dienoyl-CoA reductase-like NADH-dependent reductase (Old Yellow Enzyme family)/thioredoxin reductase